MADPVFQYSRPGFALEVFPTYIKVREGTLIKKKVSILTRNVIDVQVAGITKKLKLSTQDGKTREFNVGADANAARDAILSTLS